MQDLGRCIGGHAVLQQDLGRCIGRCRGQGRCDAANGVAGDATAPLGNERREQNIIIDIWLRPVCYV